MKFPTCESCTHCYRRNKADYICGISQKDIVLSKPACKFFSNIFWWEE